VREYAPPLSASAIITLCILAVSVLLFFIGGGILITRVVNTEKLARVQQSNISLLTFSALCIALATVLSQIRLYRMPMGGSVTAFSMLPIVLVGYWYGTKAGMTAGAVYGLLRLMLGAYVVHPIQFILDYPLAYAALGAFCLFRGKRFGLQISYLAGATGRFLCSFTAGIVWFSDGAAAGQHAWAYSAVYQLTYLVPEVIVTLIVISMPPVANAIERLRLARMKVKG
jgi:thiamine transporter